MILTTDLHFAADEEYRWHVFDALSELVRHDKRLYILGDLTDRRDRHPSDLVNRLVDTLTNLHRQYKVTTTILCGNHDRPLYAEKPYWSFLSSIDGIQFIRQPTAEGRLLLLPYTEAPAEDWRDIDFSLYRAGFMHQSLHGADIGHGQRYQAKNDPLAVTLPAGFKFYSGDIHVPQTIRMGTVTIVYVGAPHPVKFGDDHPCRLLQLDDATFEIAREIPLRPMNKHMLQITNASDLVDFRVNRGDQAKVTLTMDVNRIGDWHQEEAAIATWARQHGVTLAEVQPVVQTAGLAKDAPAELSDPVEVLVAYAEANGLDEDMLIAGLDLIEEAKGTVL